MNDYQRKLWAAWKDYKAKHSELPPTAREIFNAGFYAAWIAEGATV